MVQPMRKPPPYYARYAEGLSPQARAVWDALAEEGNRHWLFDQAWQCRTLDDPDLALVVGELQAAMVDRLRHPWRLGRRRRMALSIEANVLIALLGRSS